MLNLSPIILTTLLSTFTFLITALGGAVIFFFKKINKTLMQLTLSFSAGIMIASSFFSLILEAIEQCKDKNQNPALVSTIGIFLGVVFIVLMELYVDKKLTKSKFISKYVTEKNKQSVLTVFAISLHNIPEGMCIGVAFAGASLVGTIDAIVSAILLAVGIGIQNFPEGASVSMPLFNAGFSKKTSFILSMLSGIVEPIFALLGFYFTTVISSILPLFLTFSAGTMIAVSCTELLPESLGDNKKIATIGLGLGFCFMMLLDLLF